MIKAFLRLFAILATSVAIIGGALFFLRWLGSSQEFAPLNHPLANRPYLVFADGGDTQSAPPQSLQALKSLPKKCPQCIAKIDARRSLDGQWFAYPSQDLSDWTDNDGYFSLQQSHKIDSLRYKTTNYKILKLEELIELLPEQPFLIVIHSRDASQLNEVLEALKPRKSQENLIIQSPFRQILKDARQERPTWLFGVSTSGMARLVMMEALFIETMADIWSDLIISPESLHNTKIFTPRLLAEFERRHKLIIVDSPQNLDQLPDELRSAMDGVITKDLQKAISFFDSRAQ